MDTRQMTRREEFFADARTDDWCDLCDALGIDYSGELEHDDLNSRQLRKRVTRWAEANGWTLVDEAIATLA